MKELLIYGQIFAWSATEFIQSFVDINADDDLAVRLNSEGGDVLYGWGMIAKFMEHSGKKTVKVDGKAYSMGAFYCVYADDVEGLDVSQYMIHRAGYNEWFERSEYFTDDIKANLKSINDHLLNALKAKIDIPKFEEIAGHTLKEIFSMDSRIDVYLDAKQAKAIGLIDRIVKITPKKVTSINSEMARIAASYGVQHKIEPVVEAVETETEKPKNEGIMNVEELKAKYPEAVALIVAAAIAGEKDRVGAWLVNNDIDPVAVAEGIKSGENLSQTAMAEFGVKRLSSNALSAIETETETEVETQEETPVASAAQKELDSFESQVNALAGVNVEAAK